MFFGCTTERYNFDEPPGEADEIRVSQMEGLREKVEGWIAEFVPRYCAEHGEEQVWREPLVGLADAASPLFPQLREIAYPGHKMPQDYLPGAKTVISYFMPFKEGVARDNSEGDRPTAGWAHAYDLTNTMCAEMNRYIAERVRELGYAAQPPEDAYDIVDGTYSRWSQRHVARIAGLGNFGMNQMLISEAGCCGRYFSVITSMPCDHDEPCTRELCLHKLNGGCGKCMRACPAGALSDEGFDRNSCRDRCGSNLPTVGRHVCGKCQVGMPCTFRDPTSGCH